MLGYLYTIQNTYNIYARCCVWCIVCYIDLLFQHFSCVFLLFLLLAFGYIIISSFRSFASFIFLFSFLLHLFISIVVDSYCDLLEGFFFLCTHTHRTHRNNTLLSFSYSRCSLLLIVICWEMSYEVQHSVITLLGCGFISLMFYHFVCFICSLYDGWKEKIGRNIMYPLETKSKIVRIFTFPSKFSLFLSFAFVLAGVVIVFKIYCIQTMSVYSIKKKRWFIHDTE